MPNQRAAPQLVSMDPILIDGKGVLIVPSIAQEARFTRICCQVVRDRSNKSENFKHFEPRSFYGHFQLRINGYESSWGEIGWGKQELYFYDNIAAQIQQQIHCSTENINNNLVVVYAGITAGVPGPVYPGIDIIPQQPPFLPRCPLDEIWVKTDGLCQIAIWAEYLPVDFLCDSAKGNFAPKDSDRGPEKNIPNPTGSGNDGQPSGGQDVSGIPPAPDKGNGQGDKDPFDVPGTVWRIIVNGSGKNAFCESYSGQFYEFGPFLAKPTISFPKDGTKGDGSGRCGFADERHVRVIVNGVDVGGANGFGLQLVPLIQKKLPGTNVWV